MSLEVQRRRFCLIKASQHLGEIAATDPGALQTLLVGAALVLTVGAAVFNGLKASDILRNADSGHAAETQARIDMGVLLYGSLIDRRLKNSCLLWNATRTACCCELADCSYPSG